MAAKEKAMSDRVTTRRPRRRPAGVGPKAAAAKLAALDEIPGLQDESEQVLAQMVEDDRLYVESLAAIRKAASLTQVQLGEHMGVPQSVISRLEKQDDMLLSTLAEYLEAAGEHPRVVVTVNGRDVEYDLSRLPR